MRRPSKPGCDDYDTKPIELPRLLAKIEALSARDGRSGETSVTERAKSPAMRPGSRYRAEFLHDLRTPLNQIIGYSEMLAEQAEEEGQAGFVPDLQKIQTAGRQLLALLNNGVPTPSDTPS